MLSVDGCWLNVRLIEYHKCSESAHEMRYFKESLIKRRFTRCGKSARNREGSFCINNRGKLSGLLLSCLRDKKKQFLEPREGSRREEGVPDKLGFQHSNKVNPQHLEGGTPGEEPPWLPFFATLWSPARASDWSKSTRRQNVEDSVDGVHAASLWERRTGWEGVETVWKANGQHPEDSWNGPNQCVFFNKTEFPSLPKCRSLNQPK